MVNLTVVSSLKFQHLYLYRYCSINRLVGDCLIILIFNIFKKGHFLIKTLRYQKIALKDLYN